MFGKTAENCANYIHKGSLVGIIGSIRTGSYESNGQRVYTTDVNASRVEFLDSKGSSQKAEDNNEFPEEPPENEDDDIPF